MNKTLFQDTAKNLNEIYDFLKANSQSIVDVLSGKELKAYFDVVDLCDAIYAMEEYGCVDDEED